MHCKASVTKKLSSDLRLSYAMSVIGADWTDKIFQQGLHSQNYQVSAVTVVWYREKTHACTHTHTHTHTHRFTTAFQYGCSTRNPLTCLRTHNQTSLKRGTEIKATHRDHKVTEGSCSSHRNTSAKGRKCKSNVMILASRAAHAHNYESEDETTCVHGSS